MYKQSERLLAEAVGRGDRKAFEALVKEYERLVLHIITPMVGVTEDREDICQEVFIKVYRGIRSFKFDSKLSTWIGRIAYNTSLNFIRKRKTVQTEEIVPIPIGEEGRSGQESGDVFTAIDPSPEDRAIDMELKRSVNEAINQLPEMQRITIVLFHLEELSLTEISTIMELPENTVKSHLFRARKTLKQKFNR